jgi:hypothetical protein
MYNVKYGCGRNELTNVNIFYKHQYMFVWCLQIWPVLCFLASDYVADGIESIYEVGVPIRQILILLMMG